MPRGMKKGGVVVQKKGEKKGGMVAQKKALGGDIGKYLGNWAGGDRGANLGQLGGDLIHGLGKEFGFFKRGGMPKAKPVSKKGLGGILGGLLGSLVGGPSGGALGQQLGGLLPFKRGGRRVKTKMC